MGSTLKIAGLFISLLLATSFVGIAAASASGSISSSTCTNAVVDAKVLDAKVPFTTQSARALTESSSQYLSAVSGYSVTYEGVGNEWNFHSTTCTVSWDSFAIAYLLKAANGSLYSLTLGVNPGNNDVFGATLKPSVDYSLPINQSSTTYSGYALAANSNYNSEVNYTTAEWYIPKISAPSGNCGNNPLTTPLSCELAVWIGLQNSTYDGTNHVPAHGEVIQTGTEGDCYTSCSSPSFSGWSEYLNGNSNGVVQTSFHSCNSHFSAAASDEMYAVVGSQEAINGTTGNKFYTELRDFSNGTICEFAYLNNSTSCGSSTCKIAGKEYFADYFAERPQSTDAGIPFMLPVFHLPGSGYDLFYTMGMITSTTGAYSYYNNGYYLTSHMANGGTTNTQNSIVYKNSGTYYAYFNETWKSSANTGS